jgi:hypothetical protein
MSLSRKGKHRARNRLRGVSEVGEPCRRSENARLTGAVAIFAAFAGNYQRRADNHRSNLGDRAAWGMENSEKQRR